MIKTRLLKENYITGVITAEEYAKARIALFK